MEKKEYTDKIILALRSKYREKQAEHLPADKEIILRGKRIALHREILFDGKCSILLPEIMVDMDYSSRAARYRSPNRPPIIKTDYGSGATMTFSLLPATNMVEEESLSERLEKMQSDIKKVWKQNVFYDRDEILAEGEPVVWMDFRAFCLDGSLYTMLFMFQVEEQIVLGNFHCSFTQYDIWKPVVLKLLTTVKKEETKNEGISDQSRAI